MREDDVAHLNKPFGGPPPNNVPHAFADALSASVPSARALAKEVYADLDDKRLGVGWWAPYPDTRRRILISDYLYSCCENIETHLVEAKIHLMEVLECWEREAANIRIVHDERGMPRPAHLPARSPADYLPTARSDMHTAGFFSAILGSLDCLGAAIVGVTAIPSEIVRARLDRARKSLSTKSPPTSEGERLRVVFGEKLESLIASAGPHGWLAWVDDFRNTSVHRARRLQGCQVKPHRPVLGPDGRPLPTKADLIFHLPADPGRTDIEAFSAANHEQLLQENGTVTLHGVFGSARAIVDAACSELLAFWRARRECPDLLHQPAQQWPKVELFSTGFEGYAPGSEEFKPGLYSSNPDLVRRLAAASLLNDKHKDWSAF